MFADAGKTTHNGDGDSAIKGIWQYISFLAYPRDLLK